MTRTTRTLLATMLALAVATVYAQSRSAWNQRQKPFHIFGSTYYVGTRGLSAILITSNEGHILIDGAIPEAAKQIVSNIRLVGFNIEDVKLIVNSHTHFDHAGGIAELQKLSGATVAASESSAKVLESGVMERDDPQFGSLPAIKRIAKVRRFKDKETLHVGPLAITAHLTPGHTPGGTSWTWKACEPRRCLDIVYADSLTPVSAPGFLYTDSARNPNGAKQLEQSFDVISALPCHILVTPHPESADVFGKLVHRQEDTDGDDFLDKNDCRTYAQVSRDLLNKRIAEETGKLPR